MIKRYEGNSGRMIRIEESRKEPEPPAPATPPAGRMQAPPDLLRSVRRLLPRGLDALETEDLLLMLILYLLYRDSGDSDWLLILGGLLLG